MSIVCTVLFKRVWKGAESEISSLISIRKKAAIMRLSRNWETSWRKLGWRQRKKWQAFVYLLWMCVCVLVCSGQVAEACGLWGWSDGSQQCHRVAQHQRRADDWTETLCLRGNQSKQCMSQHAVIFLPILTFVEYRSVTSDDWWVRQEAQSHVNSWSVSYSDVVEYRRLNLYSDVWSKNTNTAKKT